MAEILLFLIAAVIHECGHMIAAGMAGAKLVRLKPRGIGAVMHYDFSSCGYMREAAVHFAGSFSNIVSASIAGMMYGGTAYYFCGISLTLAFVNLLPIKGFDGGGVARCILSQFLMPDIAWKICGVMSILGIVTLLTSVLWVELRCGGNLMLIMFVLFIMIGQMK